MNITISKIKDKINSSDIARRMASGAIWTFTGTALAKLIVLVAGILCARILGKELYGEFGMVRSTINMFVVLGSAGLGMTATKYISEYRKDQKSRIASIYLLTNRFALITGFLVSILIIAFADKIAINTLDSPQLVIPFKFGAILLFFTVLLAAQNGVLYGLEDFKSVAINAFIGSVFETVFMLIGAYYYGVIGAVIGFGCGFIAQFVANKFSIQRSFKREGVNIAQGGFNVDDFKLLYKFSLPAMLSSVIVAPIFWVIRTMLVNSSGYGDLAIYEAVDQWNIIMLAIPSLLSQVLLPILSSIEKQKKKNYWKVLKINILTNFGITTIIAVIVIIVRDKIMLSYGDDFFNTAPLVIISISAIFASVSKVVGVAISSSGKMWYGFCFNFIWGIVLIMLCDSFLKKGLGVNGLAYALLISYIVHTIIQLIFLNLQKKGQ